MNRVGHPALYLVDTISSLASYDFRMDEWGVDLVVGGSQKGLMLPPGMAFTAINARAWEAAQSARSPRRYWDWRPMIENGRLVQQGTPAEITARPLTPYVAGVVGTNLYRACSSPARGVVQVQGGGQFHTDTELSAAPLLVALRPSAVTVHGRRPTEAVNVWCGMIESLRAVGDRVRLDVEARPRVCVDVSTGTVAELGLAAGVQIWLSANPVDVSVYPVPNEDHSTVTKSMSSSTARSSEASTSQ